MKKRFRKNNEPTENEVFHEVQNENADQERKEESDEMQEQSEENSWWKKKRILPIVIGGAAVVGAAIGIIVGVGNVQKQTNVVQAVAEQQISNNVDTDNKEVSTEKSLDSQTEKTSQSEKTQTTKEQSEAEQKNTDDAEKDNQDKEDETDKSSSTKSGNKDTDQDNDTEDESNKSNNTTGSKTNDTADVKTQENTQAASTPAAAQNQSSSNSTASETYVPSSITPTPAPHVHNWKEQVRTVHHDAVTEQVKVVDVAAYTEPVYEEVPVYEQVLVNICNVCGEEFEDVYEHSMVHIDWDTMTNPFSYTTEFRQGAQFGTEQRQTGTISHPEQSHMETKVVKAAYDEQIVDGYVCTGCGATK